MTNRHPGCPGPDCDFCWRELERDAERRGDSRVLWAMRVLWKWAEKHEEATIPTPVFHRYMSKVDGARLPSWKAPVVFADADGVFRGIGIQVFGSPEEATIAIAEALAKQDPALGR